MKGEWWRERCECEGCIVEVGTKVAKAIVGSRLVQLMVRRTKIHPLMLYQPCPLLLERG